AHLINPRDVVPESNMPAYRRLARNSLKIEDLSLHLKAQRAIGVPYTDEMIENATTDAYDQATPGSGSVVDLKERYGDETQVRAFDGVATSVTEMDALIAYLQVLGRLTNAAFEDTAAPEEPPGPIE